MPLLLIKITDSPKTILPTHQFNIMKILVRILLIGQFSFLLILSSKSQQAFQPSTFSEDGSVVLVPWNSDEGKKRLARSKHKTDFFQLADRFQPQINPLYCGIATTTIILNTFRLGYEPIPSQAELEVDKPKAFGGGKIPYPSYSQWTLLNENTDKVKVRDIINLTNISEENTNDASQFEPGLSLAQLSGIQNLYGLGTKVYYAEQEPSAGSSHFRNQLKEVLQDSTQFLVVNFVGTLIGTTTGGHISPLAAYDKRSDSVLILDVAGHKNPWYWVPVEHLYKSMHSKDGVQYRGWVVISN